METESKAAVGGVLLSANQHAETLTAHLGYWLRLVSNEVSGAFERALQECHISVAEWVALNQLAAGTDWTSARLATTMAMTRGAVSKVLDKLEAKRLISRTTSSLDSRVQVLSLTENARRNLPNLIEIANNNDEHFFAALTTNEMALLRRLLRKLAAAHRMIRIPLA